jgi:hypothetical protein
MTSPHVLTNTLFQFGQGFGWRSRYRTFRKQGLMHVGRAMANGTLNGDASVFLGPYQS